MRRIYNRRDRARSVGIERATMSEGETGFSWLHLSVFEFPPGCVAVAPVPPEAQAFRSDCS